MFISPFTLRIQNSEGKTFELTNDTSNYVITSVDGLLRPVTDIHTSSGTSDGETFNSAKMQKRNITITIRLRGQIETNRQRLYTIFPAKKACTVFYKNQNRDVCIKGYVEVMDGSIFEEREKIQISIICPDPYFENLAFLYEELTQVTKLFEFPFSIEVDSPIPFSEVGNLSYCTLVNNGDVECGCVITIEISGDVTELYVYNLTTQQKFGLSYEFQADDTIIINTKSGKEKGVFLFRNGETTSLLSYMKRDSSWIQLAAGANEFSFTSDNRRYVKIGFKAVERYGGV